MSKIIYEAFFITDTKTLECDFPCVFVNRFYHHATIAFKPSELSFPERLGEQVVLKAIGQLTTDKVDVLIVEMPFDLNVEYPHITLSTAEGIAPVESKNALKEKKFGFGFEVPIFVNARYGFFDGNQEVYGL